MGLDPKIPYRKLKNIDFRVSGVDGGVRGGPGRPVALFSYDKDSPIFHGGLSGSIRCASIVPFEAHAGK